MLFGYLMCALEWILLRIGKSNSHTLLKPCIIGVSSSSSQEEYEFIINQERVIKWFNPRKNHKESHAQMQGKIVFQSCANHLEKKGMMT